MQRKMIVTVDIQIARRMLRIAGYDVSNKSDEEVFELAIGMNDCYGVAYEESER